MRVVIVGANGQLGSDCKLILADGNDVSSCDIPEFDITSQSGVDAYLEKAGPDVIINCAAFTAVDNCEKQVDLCWKVNADGPKHLAIAAERLGCRLIHTSTDYVFDGKLDPPNGYDETAPTNPLSEYGKSKLVGEENVTANCSNSLILRTAWLYSAWGNNFLKTMLRLALNNPGKELKVVDDQYGSLTCSDSLARQIKRLMSTDLKGIIHATSDNYSSWHEVACYFLDKMGVDHSIVPCTTEEYPTLAHRPANSILINKVINNAGISAFVDWREELDLFVKNHKERLLAEVMQGQKG